VHHRGVQRGQVGERDARNRVQQYHAVRGRHVGQVVAARVEPGGRLAGGDAVLGHVLVVGHDRAAAAPPDEYDLVDGGQRPQVRHAGGHVQREAVPCHLGLVGELRFDAQHGETALRQLHARNAADEVVRLVGEDQRGGLVGGGGVRV